MRARRMFIRCSEGKYRWDISWNKAETSETLAIKQK